MTVHQAPDVKYATVVHVLPYAEDLEGVTGETFETFLQPFFEGEFKPVRRFCFCLLLGSFRVIFASSTWGSTECHYHACDEENTAYRRSLTHTVGSGVNALEATVSFKPDTLADCGDAICSRRKLCRMKGAAEICRSACPSNAHGLWCKKTEQEVEIPPSVFGFAYGVHVCSSWFVRVDSHGWLGPMRAGIGDIVSTKTLPEMSLWLRYCAFFMECAPCSGRWRVRLLKVVCYLYCRICNTDWCLLRSSLIADQLVRQVFCNCMNMSLIWLVIWWIKQ